MAGPDRRTLSEDALNRYRITHSDRDLRPLVRRLHRLPHLSSAVGESSTSQDAEEKELLHLEVLKWKAGIERVMASVRNLDRQKASYAKRASSTATRTTALQAMLAEEKTLLSHKLKERDQQLQCDEVADRILARGKTRKELDELIISLREEIAAQQAAVAEYQSISRSRIDQWAQIGPIIEGVRGWKLPIDNTPTIDEDKMDVDEVPLPAGGGTKLSATAAPFQPGGSSGTSAAAGGSTPPPLPPAVSRSSSSSHNLPARPNNSRASPGPTGGGGTASGVTRSNSSIGGVGGIGRAMPSTLPTRPSGLRSSTTTGAIGRGSLEEGELGGEEEGEVSEERSRGSRSGRSRK